MISHTGPVVVVGEALIDRVVTPDGGVSDSPGGSPANVALTLGRLGRHPAFVTRLGADNAGKEIEEWLSRSGVHLQVMPPRDTTTGIATAILDVDGNAHYEFDLRWDLVDEIEIDRRAEAVHLGSIGAILRPGADTVLRYATQARAEATIFYDPNIRPALIEDPAFALERVETLVALADVVKASEDDLRWLYPNRSVQESGAAWLALGPAVVIVTVGSGGAFALSRAGRVDCASPSVTVADTVGAGDTFMGAFIDGLMSTGLCGSRHRDELNGIDADLMKRLLRRSAFAAAVTVSRVGANPPWHEEMELAFPSRLAAKQDA
jgi:fructokinase